MPKYIYSVSNSVWSYYVDSVYCVYSVSVKQCCIILRRFSKCTVVLHSTVDSAVVQQCFVTLCSHSECTTLRHIVQNTHKYTWKVPLKAKHILSPVTTQLGYKFQHICSICSLCSLFTYLNAYINLCISRKYASNTKVFRPVNILSSRFKIVA